MGSADRHSRFREPSAGDPQRAESMGSSSFRAFLQDQVPRMNAASGASIDAEPELDLADAALVEYWSYRLRCTPVELMAVVGRFGRTIALVKSELARRAAAREYAALPLAGADFPASSARWKPADVEKRAG
jgi:hypothetical protein